MSELKEILKNIAEEKNTKITPENLRQGVEAFGVQGTFTADATATAEDIVKDKTAYVNGKKVVGNLEVSTSSSSIITNGQYLFYNGIRLDHMNELLELCDGLTGAESMFYGCTTLTELDLSGLDTSNLTTMSSTFSGCTNLVTLNMENCDLGKITKISNIFSNCSNLTNIKSFKNLGKGYPASQSQQTNTLSLDLKACTKLTHESLIDLIDNGLHKLPSDFDPNSSQTHGMQRLSLSSTSYNLLTSDEIARARQKGWIVSTS